MKVRTKKHADLDMQAEKNYLGEGMYVDGKWVKFKGVGIWHEPQFELIVCPEPKGVWINGEYWRYGLVYPNGDYELLICSKMND